jgi:hypothetical protein
MNRLVIPFPQAATGPTTCNIAYRSAGTVHGITSGTSNLAVLPSGWQANDVCLCVNYNNGTDAVSIASGWTQIFQSGHYTVWYRRMQAGDTAPTITGITNGYPDAAVIFAFSGCTTSATPVGAASTSFTQNDSSGDNVACNGINTANAYSKVVMLVACYWNGSYASTTWSNWAVGTNTPTKEAFPWHFGAPYLGVCLADYAQAAAGATGTASATSSNIPYNYMWAALVELITS